MPTAFFLPRADAAWRRPEIAEWLDDDFDPASEAIFVVETADGRVDGFIHLESGDKGGLGATGLVNLLYVDPDAQGRGFGRALMAAGAAWHLANHPGPLALSAFRDNPYRSFYGAMGGIEAAETSHVIEGAEIRSVLYLWPEPRTLIG